MRTLILSDLHLGSRSSRARESLPQLQRLCARYDRVILNGDILDRYDQSGTCQNTDSLAREARERLSSRSGAPEILCGNHDPGWLGRNWLYLEESQTLVYHGDCILDLTHPSRQQDQLQAAHLGEAWRMRGGRPTEFLELVDLYRQLQREFLIANPTIYARQHGSMLYVLRAFLPPQRPFQVFAYWHRAPGMVARLARTFDRPVKHVVVGHSHRAGEWTLDGVRVLNTGSFMPLSHPMGVEVDGARVSLKSLSDLLRVSQAQH